MAKITATLDAMRGKRRKGDKRPATKATVGELMGAKRKVADDDEDGY